MYLYLPWSSRSQKYVYQNSVCMSALERHLQVGQGGLHFIYFWFFGVVQRFVGNSQFTNVILKKARGEVCFLLWIRNVEM